MTEKDKKLIEKARRAGMNYAYIETLGKEAESIEAKQYLKDLENYAFRAREIAHFDI